MDYIYLFRLSEKADKLRNLSPPTSVLIYSFKLVFFMISVAVRNKNLLGGLELNTGLELYY